MADTGQTTTADKKRSAVRTPTLEDVETHFDLFKVAVGVNNCGSLGLPGAAEQWHSAFASAHVTMDELSAGLSRASDLGTPFGGLSLAWVMGLIREYRQRQQEEADRQERLPKGGDVLHDARVRPEDMPYWQHLKACVSAIGKSERDMRERLDALKALQDALYGPNARWPGPIGGGFTKNIERLEKKLADEEATQARDEQFVAGAGGDVGKLEDRTAKQKAVQAEPTKMVFDESEAPF